MKKKKKTVIILFKCLSSVSSTLVTKQLSHCFIMIVVRSYFNFHSAISLVCHFFLTAWSFKPPKILQSTYCINISEKKYILAVSLTVQYNLQVLVSAPQNMCVKNIWKVLWLVLKNQPCFAQNFWNLWFLIRCEIMGAGKAPGTKINAGCDMQRDRCTSHCRRLPLLSGPHLLSTTPSVVSNSKM